MTVRVNGSFSPFLPVNGGCPQGSLLSVMLFDVSIDDVKLTQTPILPETPERNLLHVADFYDDAGRNTLRNTESPGFDQYGDLVPGISVPSDDFSSSSTISSDCCAEPE